MQALPPLLSDAEQPEVQDNAAGAVARMFLALHTQLPLDQVRWPQGTVSVAAVLALHWTQPGAALDPATVLQFICRSAGRVVKEACMLVSADHVSSTLLALQASMPISLTHGSSSQFLA